MTVMSRAIWYRGALLGCAMVMGVSCAGQQQQPAPAPPPPSPSPQAAQMTQAVSPPERLHPPESLSPMAKAILNRRMASHAREMRDLVSAIVVLQYDEIQAGALRIAGDVTLSRPLSEDATELNAALPEQFFVYQDRLRQEAKTLAGAASRQNAGEIADSYGRLSQVCVRCHATYRAGR
jgi:hypothetical protein